MSWRFVRVTAQPPELLLQGAQVIVIDRKSPCFKRTGIVCTPVQYTRQIKVSFDGDGAGYFKPNQLEAQNARRRFGQNAGARAHQL